MANLVIITNDKNRVSVDSVEGARVAYDKWVNGRILSSRSYKAVPVIDVDAKKVLGFFSVNGEYWSVDAIGNDRTLRSHFELLSERFFNKHL
ncbi:hypothetical protein pf16_36 [Pseudomonas phage pf16]|uniref:Uncharacterized protein n=1 Tax=Pseudomonas phage pf16 TaxID=1815630 RepID=A0A1S5R3I7_9CAUD|nr:hypothetical protein FDG98_gp035 [Pseudomonas phage pf16]AND74959.1 hypothetical protein pf16_36 [Pseudomonas phage pf16]